jgi:site-specific recombinase XerD
MLATTGFPILSAMRGRRKGGASAPPVREPQGVAAHAADFLAHLSARSYTNGTIDAHRWALRQFCAWADGLGMHDPARHTRADLADYQIFLHQYRNPRSGKPLGTNTQLARIGCVRRFFVSAQRMGIARFWPGEHW